MRGCNAMNSKQLKILVTFLSMVVVVVLPVAVQAVQVELFT